VLEKWIDINEEEEFSPRRERLRSYLGWDIVKLLVPEKENWFFF